MDTLVDQMYHDELPTEFMIDSMWDTYVISIVVNNSEYWGYIGRF
jgi:hypothetical protein